MKKVALVTGGSRGIGRSISVSLASNGYFVIINYLSNKGAAQETLDLCGGNGLIICADVSTSEGRASLLKEIGNYTENMSVLVNNAGITRDNLLIRMSESDWDSVVQTNFVSIVELITLFLPTLQRQSCTSKIINISSTVGLHGNAGQMNYSAAKSALISYTKILARELMPKIQVNAIAPGLVQTDMTAKFDLAKLADTKLGRAAKADEIAGCVEWLVTKGDYITGQVLEIDGGLSLWSSVESLV